MCVVLLFVCHCFAFAFTYVCGIINFFLFCFTCTSTQSLWYYFLCLIVDSARGGDYYRLLIDGDYTITAEKEGYEPVSKQVIVENQMHQDSAQILDFDLPRAKGKNQGYDKMYDEDKENSINAEVQIDR